MIVDRWLLLSIIGAAHAMGLTAVAILFPNLPINLELAAGVVTLVILMSRHPAYWFRRMSESTVSFR